MDQIVESGMEKMGGSLWRDATERGGTLARVGTELRIYNYDSRTKEGA
jgi:hypothetical protein